MTEPLIGLPGSEPGFAMPMMRGFPCTVATPMMHAQPGTSPPQGVGVGWSHVIGKGVHFFLSVHGADDDVLVAQLNYGHYRRLCELLASAGQQAMLVPGVEERVPNDPMAALGVAYSAMEKVIDQAGECYDGPDVTELETAMQQVGAALGIIR